MSKDVKFKSSDVNTAMNKGMNLRDATKSAIRKGIGSEGIRFNVGELEMILDALDAVAAKKRHDHQGALVITSEILYRADMSARHKLADRLNAELRMLL